MPTMVIAAVFPLGVYLGHGSDGRPSAFPDTARLHAGLVNAAGQGSLAEEVDGALRPSARAVSALRWLESNPPSGLVHPPMVPVALRGRVLAWRFEGVMESKKNPVPRRVQKSQSDGVAMGGVLGWSWNVPVPDGVRDTLDELCADVSCLGEADSPVVLKLPDPAGWEPTHELDARQSGFPAEGGLRVRTPLEGRLDELEADYRTAYPVSRPTAAADRHSWGANPSSPTPSASRVRLRVYRPAQPEVDDIPWSQLVVFQLEQHPDLSDTVGWSVAMHRALAAQLGDEAPAILTGKYRSGALMPPNRLAVQVALPHPARRLHPEETLLVLMLPAEASAEERASLHRAVTGVRRIYRKEGTAVLGEPDVVEADDFWALPAAGTTRLWRPHPSVVPEVRRLPAKEGRTWTLADAGALSVGFVFRGAFGDVYPTGKDRYWSIAATIREYGVRWHETRLLRDEPVSRHAHKAPKDLVVQPVTGLADMARLVSPGTLFALGQSRHLGGGLMIPEDIPEHLARQRGLT